MTINLALEYIPRRMAELGYGNNYHLHFRHFVMQPMEEEEIEAYNQFFILVEGADNVCVESETGFFDLANHNTNEMQYEHRGRIHITNYGPLVNHVRFIQVFPKI